MCTSFENKIHFVEVKKINPLQKNSLVSKGSFFYTIHSPTRMS